MSAGFSVQSRLANRPAASQWAYDQLMSMPGGQTIHQARQLPQNARAWARGAAGRVADKISPGLGMNFRTREDVVGRRIPILDDPRKYDLAQDAQSAVERNAETVGMWAGVGKSASERKNAETYDRTLASGIGGIVGGVIVGGNVRNLVNMAPLALAGSGGTFGVDPGPLSPELEQHVREYLDRRGLQSVDVVRAQPLAQHFRPGKDTFENTGPISKSLANRCAPTGHVAVANNLGSALHEAGHAVDAKAAPRLLLGRMVTGTASPLGTLVGMGIAVSGDQDHDRAALGAATAGALTVPTLVSEATASGRALAELKRIGQLNRKNVVPIARAFGAYLAGSAAPTLGAYTGGKINNMITGRRPGHQSEEGTKSASVDFGEPAAKSESNEPSPWMGAAQGVGGLYVLDKAAPGLMGKRVLFHGTSKDNARSIRQHGFDPARGGSEGGAAAAVNSEGFKKRSQGHVHFTTSKAFARLMSGFPSGTLVGDASKGEKPSARGIIRHLVLGSPKGEVLRVYANDNRVLEHPSMTILGNIINKPRAIVRDVKTDAWDLDPDAYLTARTSEHVPTSQIGRKGLLHDLRGLPGRIKSSPGRFGRALALTAGSGALINAGVNNLMGEPEDPAK